MSRKVLKNWGHPLLHIFLVWGCQAKIVETTALFSPPPPPPPHYKWKIARQRKIPLSAENSTYNWKPLKCDVPLGNFREIRNANVLIIDWLVNNLHCKIFLRLSSWANQSRFSVDCGQSKTDNYLMNKLDSMRGKFEAGRAILYKLWTTCEV